jgi:aminoglycoside/choline kinase family phosphotransferase
MSIPPPFSKLELRESLGDVRGVWRTERGILKCCMSPREAERESSALVLAQQIVGTQVRVPRILQQHNDFLLLEDVGRLSPETLRHSGLAAEYLARIHRVEVSDEVVALLSDKGHSHYWREALSNRLREEGLHAKEAFRSETESVDAFLRCIESVLADEVPDHGDVVGHGDFQSQNLCFTDSDGVCAVDWNDFGLCNRWYEIAHFLYALPEAHRPSAVDAYQAESRVALPNWNAGLRYGQAVDRIIRAGNRSRLSTALKPLFDEFRKLVDDLDAGLL